MLLVLEDLHWADDATLRLLQYLTPRLTEMRLLVVATYRDVELDVARPLAAALRQLTKDRLATRIALRRLPEADVAAMLAALSGREPAPTLVAAIHHETEGNPFFVEEVYEHLSEEGRLFDAAGNWRTDLTMGALDVPEGVRLVVGRRLERLSGDGRRALTVAAVVGRRFSYPLVERAADLDSDVLLDGIEGAERLRLIEPDPDASAREPQYRFSHELIRQTLLGGLSIPRRQRLHVRVADALEQQYPDSLEKHASMLAHHLYEAGVGADETKTIRFLTLAGDQAMESGGFEEALRSFDHALSLEPGDRAVRASLLSRRGMAQRSLDRWDAAISDLTDALALYEPEADRPAVVATCRELAHAYVWTQRPSESVEFSRKGLSACGEEPSPDRSRLLAYLGWALSNLSDLDPADEAVTESLEMVRRVGDPRLEGRVLCTNFSYYLHSWQSAGAYACADRAVQCLRSAGDSALLASALVYQHFASVRTGRLDSLVRLEAEAGALIEKAPGRLDLRIVALFMTHRKFLETADLNLFREFTQRWAKVSAAMDAWGFLGEAWEAQLRMWRGEWVEARKDAERATGHEPHPSVHFGECWGMLFLSECLLGNREQALALLAKRGADLPQAGRFNGNGQWSALLRVVEGLEILGESARAAALYPLTVEAIATGTVVSWDANHLLETVAGMAASAGGNWPTAQQHFDTALRQADEVPFRSEQAEARRWYARMLLNRNEPGDRDKARTLLGKATEMYRTIGMPKHLELVEKMSAAL